MEALRRYTLGSAWFSADEDKKGSLEVGKLADLAVLSADYFSVADDEIKGIESLLTIVGGKVVYAAGDYAQLAPPALPVSPGWSPVKAYGGYAAPLAARSWKSHGVDQIASAHQSLHFIAGQSSNQKRGREELGLACDCFAF